MKSALAQLVEPVMPTEGVPKRKGYLNSYLLVLCDVISGSDGWTSIALYGQKKLELLRRFLPFENGTPCHD